MWHQQVFSHKTKDLPTSEEVITGGHQVCKIFVSKKLRKLNLIKPVGIPELDHKKHSFSKTLAYQSVHAISSFMLGGPGSGSLSSDSLKSSCEDFLEVASQLEGMYPDLYKNVSSQMGINIGWEQEKIGDAYWQFAQSLLHKPGETEPSIYWAKIISLLCVASGLSVDCARNGKWDVIPKVIETFDRIVAQNLVRWIIEQNGWVLPPNLKPDPFSRLKKFFLIFNTFLAIFVATLFVAWHFY